MVMAMIVNENFSSKKLKDLAKNYLNAPCDENEDLKKVKKEICRERGIRADEFQYDMIPPEILYPYALKDTEYTLKLFYMFYKPLLPYRKIYEMEMQLIPIIVEMQLNGIKIDRKFLEDRIVKFGTERHYIHQECIEELNRLGIKFYAKRGKKTIEVDFNPLSPDHMRQIWITLKLPILGMTEGKNPKISTAKKILDEFLENEENFANYDIKIIKLLARFRFIHKQLGTYAVPLYTHYTSDENRRAHFNFWQSGAKTGRFSAELIQTMPRIDHDKGEEDVRMIRFAFTPEDNCVLGFIDFEQIEMRIFAHESKSELLIHDLNNGFDPHMGTVYNVFDRKLIDANPVIRDTFRSMIKAINFGIMYGMGVKALTFKIKDMIYRAAHVNPEVREEFDKILNDIPGVLRTYYSKYPADVYTRDTISNLYKKGYVEINFNSELMDYGRVYTVPRQMAYKAVNMIIQGSAAYVMKASMIRAHTWIKKHAPWIKMLLTVHDELVFEIPKDKPYVAALLYLQELMEDRKTFSIPILASIKMTEKNWGSAYGMAPEGKCKKHGQLGTPDQWNIVFCHECKKKYVAVPTQTREELFQVCNNY
jgi:DNA polymerase-1